MKIASFTVRIIGPNPHRENTNTWRAGQIITAMEGCHIKNIIEALTAFEKDATERGVGNPARWITHFAGLESAASGKKMEPWIEIVHFGQLVQSAASYRELLRLNE